MSGSLGLLPDKTKKIKINRVQSKKPPSLRLRSLITVGAVDSIIVLFSLDFTAKKALERSKKCDIPYAWDDPSSKDDVKFIVQALFNQVYYSY